MRRFLSVLLFTSLTLRAADPAEIKIWPEGAPGQMTPPSPATQEFLRTKAGKTTITNIHEPTITVFQPAKPNGTSIIVAPGGGYVFLSAVHEGTHVCEWLTTIGVTGILLKYRTPTRDDAAPHEKPAADAAQAIKLVRQKAAQWHLDPQRVGLLGFSAGGNLLAHLACDRDLSNYPTSYDDTRGGVPNFGIMIYGGGFVDPSVPSRFTKGFSVPHDAPPMFIACAHDDGQNPVAAVTMYLEYKRLGLPCELHLFSKGGHGFGIRAQNNPINAWPQRCAEWLEDAGLSYTQTGIERRLALLDGRIQKLRPYAVLNGLDDCGVYAKESEQLSVGLKQALAEGKDKEAESIKARLNALVELVTEKQEAEKAAEPFRTELFKCVRDHERLQSELKRLKEVQSLEPKSR